MNKRQKIMPLAMLFFCCELIVTALTSAAYASNESYCNPGLHHCEAPFTAGKDKISPAVNEGNSYCNPGLHSCEAPFTAGKDKIVTGTEPDSNRCNPNDHRCEAPFTIRDDHINP